MAHSIPAVAQEINGHQQPKIPTYRSLAIPESEDDAQIRQKYRPFILNEQQQAEDWADRLELDTVLDMAEKDLALTQKRLKVLVLYGSLRKRYLVLYEMKI
jgi:arsenic resistance protein ArsH